jgi:hypothetical protein
MSEYLLPCSCGQKLTVSARQAGQSVTCSCGARLEVPTLRGLGGLEQAATPAVAARRWGDRHRAVFVLVVISLVAAAGAGLLAMRMPADPTPPPPPELKADSPLAEAIVTHDELKQGLVPGVRMLSPPEQQIVKQRELMTWGIKIGLAVSLCALVAGVVVLLSPGRKK